MNTLGIQVSNTQRHVALSASKPIIAVHCHSLLEQHPRSVGSSRRSLLAAISIITPPSLAVLSLAGSFPASAAEQSNDVASSELTTVVNTAQGYTLQVPKGWEQVNKAGADALFRDPEKHSTNVGVTVLPVMIKTLKEFGDIATVGDRLVAAEKAKESTLAVNIVSLNEREAALGPLYDIQYELESTRGRKTIISAVTIVASKLYIVTATVNCDKTNCTNVQPMIQLLQTVAKSFTVRE